MNRIQIIPKYSIENFEAEIKALISSPLVGEVEMRSISGEGKIDFYSKAFLNRPYQVGALGEGEKGEFDQNPLYRTEFFDCLTYVNTVLALVHAKNLDDFQKLMLKINYFNGEAKYENRFHFTSLDWNPENIRNGFIENITENLGLSIYFAEANIDRANFFRYKKLEDLKLLEAISPAQEEALLKKLHDLGNQYSPKNVRMPYLALSDLLSNPHNWQKFEEKLPKVCIVEMVRPNWNVKEKIGTNLNVSHLGFLFKKENQLLFRHATINLGKVAEVNFFDYLKEFEYSSTLKGISLFRCK